MMLKRLSVIHESFGKPYEVLKLLEEKSVASPVLLNNDVALKMLYAPLNPSDINMIEGTYGVKRPLPAIGGNEGVGIVTKVGSNVTYVKEGDLVCPISSDFGGTWRSSSIVQENQIIRMPNILTPIEAATLCVNPSTAFRMLNDFVTLKPGDVVIQNGASSSVGLAAIQIAKSMGVKTINVIRHQKTEEDDKRMEEELMKRGGDLVLYDNSLLSDESTTKVKNLLASNTSGLKLALNMVGGPTTSDMLRLLSKKGVMVTYGGMSKKPVTIPTGAFIFNDLRFFGYWMTEWVKCHKREEIEEMHLKLANLIKDGKLSTNVSIIPLSTSPVMAMKKYENRDSLCKLIYNCQE